MLSKYVTQATVFDINQIIAIEKDSYENPWTKNHFINDLKNKHSLNYVCKINSQLIGYLFGYLIEKEYYLNKITIKKNFRKQKNGKSLFQECVNDLSNKNVRCIQLEVSSLNLSAQKFYENLNFKYVGLRKDYYFRGNHGLLYNLDVK